MAVSLVFRQERSRNGYSLKELKSALQKNIRRGNLALALYAAGELVDMARIVADDKHKQQTARRRIATNLLHRLMVITLEDVGRMDVWYAVQESYEQVKVNRYAACDGNEDAYAKYETGVATWVHLLVHAMRADGGGVRTCSHARAVGRLVQDNATASEAYALARAQFTPLADAADAVRALDIETCRQKLDASLRRHDRWLAPLYAWRIWAAKSDKAGALRLIDVLRPHFGDADILTLRAWQRELGNMREAFLGWMMPLLEVVRGLHRQRAVHDGKHVDPVHLLTPFAANARGERIALGDYVYDGLHAPGPIKDGEKYGNFAREGAALCATDARREKALWHAFYDACKQLEDGVKYEEIDVIDGVVILGKRAAPDKIESATKRIKHDESTMVFVGIVRPVDVE